MRWCETCPTQLFRLDAQVPISGKSIHSMTIRQPNNGGQRQPQSEPEASRPPQVLCWPCAKTPTARTAAGANGSVNRHGLTETTVAMANKTPTPMRTLFENRQGHRAERHHGLKREHQQSTRVRSERENRNAQHNRQGTVPKLRLIGCFPPPRSLWNATAAKKPPFL